MEPVSEQLQQRSTELVVRLGLAAREDILTINALTGGVASDIVCVETTERKFAIKFALAKLRVAEEWLAPVTRNQSEYRWLEFAAKSVPGCAPELYGLDTELQGFAMEYLQGDTTYLWKSALLARQPGSGEAASCAQALAKIHAASTLPGFDTSPFRNQATFYDLRLEPYLAFTATRHTAIANALHSLIESLQTSSRVLIHGDISPKNILFRAGQPVFLDAECATMGDPAFDAAFCINHLLLKSLHMPDKASELSTEVIQFWTHYAEQVSWEDAAHIEARVCHLLPALLLARVDGKSPVEYLHQDQQQFIRTITPPMILRPPSSLEELSGTLHSEQRQ